MNAGVKRKIVLVCLLSFGCAGSSFAGEDQGSLKYWFAKGKGWALASSGLVLTTYHIRSLLNESAKSRQQTVGYVLAGVYNLLWGVEMIYDNWEAKKEDEASLKDCARTNK